MAVCQCIREWDWLCINVSRSGIGCVSMYQGVGLAVCQCVREWDWLCVNVSGSAVGCVFVV